jgi:hypothetical protein
MKSKLVKYPFNEKKWRWDIWKLGRKFEYSWNKEPNANYSSVEPYFEYKDVEDDKNYYYADIGNDITTAFDMATVYIGDDTKDYYDREDNIEAVIDTNDSIVDWSNFYKRQLRIKDEYYINQGDYYQSGAIQEITDAVLTGTYKNETYDIELKRIIDLLYSHNNDNQYKTAWKTPTYGNNWNKEQDWYYYNDYDFSQYFCIGNIYLTIARTSEDTGDITDASLTFTTNGLLFTITINGVDYTFSKDWDFTESWYGTIDQTTYASNRYEPYYYYKPLDSSKKGGIRYEAYNSFPSSQIFDKKTESWYDPYFISGNYEGYGPIPNSSPFYSVYGYKGIYETGYDATQEGCNLLVIDGHGKMYIVSFTKNIWNNTSTITKDILDTTQPEETQLWTTYDELKNSPWTNEKYREQSRDRKKGYLPFENYIQYKQYFYSNNDFIAHSKTHLYNAFWDELFTKESEIKEDNQIFSTSTRLYLHSNYQANLLLWKEGHFIGSGLAHIPVSSKTLYKEIYTILTNDNTASDEAIQMLLDNGKDLFELYTGYSEGANRYLPGITIAKNWDWGWKIKAGTVYGSKVLTLSCNHYSAKSTSCLVPYWYTYGPYYLNNILWQGYIQTDCYRNDTNLWAYVQYKPSINQYYYLYEPTEDIKNEKLFNIPYSTLHNGNYGYSFYSTAPAPDNLPDATIMSVRYKYNSSYAFSTKINKSISTDNIKYIIDYNDWSEYISDKKYYKIVPPTDLADKKVLKPTIKWLGDITSPTYEKVEGTYEWYCIPAYYKDGVKVAKTLSINAPSSATENTWLTYNPWQDTTPSYTGRNWNNITSPFGVINCYESSYDITYDIDTLPEGKYVQVKEVLDFDTTEVFKDGVEVITYGNNEWASYYDRYMKPVPAPIEIVSSYNRHEYGDKEIREGFTYTLQPQLTRFIEYFRERETLSNCELFSDRYTYTYDTIDFCDRSYEGTICGTSSSTGEENIPEGTWREYLGVYLGETIDFLGLTRSEISPEEILSQPSYNKEVNTSETLKYGTVSSASITFTVNKPIALAKDYLNNYLILYYDFENKGAYIMMGWFYVDGVEAIDEYTSRITAHDEVYKLNKYVDDFMNSLVGTSTLDATYRALLGYCECQYDQQYPKINNGDFELHNTYNTIKTTGIEVAHYIAQISPGFIEANSDGDIVLSRYADVNYKLSPSGYTQLTYTPFEADILDKVKIIISNKTKGEDSGTGINAYYVENSPLVSYLSSELVLDELADEILNKYNDIPTYRPATVQLLTLPTLSSGDLLQIGDIVELITTTYETYKIIIMKMAIDSSGITIESMGTETYPVEGSDTSSQFINILNNATEGTDEEITEIKNEITTKTDILEQKIDNVDKTLSNRINTYGVSVKDKLATITLNGTTKDIATKDYVDESYITPLSELSTQVNGFGVNVANNLATIELNGTTSNIATSDYVDESVSSIPASNITGQLTETQLPDDVVYGGAQTIAGLDGITFIVDDDNSITFITTTTDKQIALVVELKGTKYAIYLTVDKIVKQ